MTRSTLLNVARAACVAAVALLGACTAIVPHFEHPQLSVAGVEIRDASLVEQHLRVRMHVQNPNDRELPIEGIRYTMQLGGEDFGQGATAESFTVPAHGEADFEMLVTTNLTAAFLRILPRLKDRNHPIDYRLTGEVRTALRFLRVIPFDERGSFPIR
jgi:LEA14-like dessication related protein